MSERRKREMAIWIIAIGGIVTLIWHFWIGMIVIVIAAALRERIIRSQRAAIDD